VDHLVHEVVRRGIEVRPVVADAVALAAFEQVVLATGAPQRGFAGPVHGTERVLTPADLGPRREEIRGRVVIVGGGFLGADAALRLLELPDVSVTLFDRGDQLLRGPEVKYDAMVMPKRLAEADVDVRLGTEVVAVEAKGVRVRPADGAVGDDELYEADWVVLALGREPSSSPLAEELATAGVPVVTIGSAQTPGRVYDALHTAYFTARRI
jgi:pyruvate/2-oxoglutarate dehydrogenase complex dihydrolipoamide dehydrogenase (E3) component